jgi:brefeldin A-inhibited guanine nucleotide-exchange protein
MVSDPRHKIQTKSIDTLFSILNQHGNIFTDDQWKIILHGVLRPLFDEI